MSFNKLRSHEDLSDYLDVLNDVYDSFDDPSNLIPSFSQDPHEIVQDLLSQLVNTRKKGLEIIKIAKKFYKAHSDSSLNSQNLVKEILSLQSEINTLISKVNTQSKEIETKDDRISTMSLELHETEKEYRGLLIEVEQLRKNLKTLKERKVFQKVKQPTSLLKVKEDNEEHVKSLNITIEDFKDELLRKAAEIDELNLKVKNLEDDILAEKINADKSKIFANNCKKESLDLSDRIEELEYQLEAKKSQLLRLEHELIHEKSHSENIIKQYERERSVSIASNFGTNSEFISIRSNFGTNNEFLSISSNFGTNNEVININGDVDTKEKGQNLPMYKKNAPKMETLGDWMDEENDFVEDIKPKPLLSKQPTMFVLSSPVVNYDRKFQFPDLNQKIFEIEKGEQISILQKKKNSANPTFDLKKRMKKKVFTFDDDESHDNITPLQGVREEVLAIQTFRGHCGKNILSNVKKFELEICKVGMGKFCEPRLRNWNLGVETLVNAKFEVRGKKKSRLELSIGQCFEVTPKNQNIGLSVVPGFLYKGICKSDVQGSGISVKKIEKFKLSAFSQKEMKIFCEPQSKRILKMKPQKYSTINIKPLKKPILNQIVGNSFTISPKLNKISLCITESISLKQFCTTSFQKNQISIKNSKKLLALCEQQKMTIFCKPLKKPKLSEIMCNSFTISPKLNNISLFITKNFSIKQFCTTSPQVNQISIKKSKKLLTLCDQQKMSIFCEPKFKRKNLKIEKINNGKVEIKSKQKAKLFITFENTHGINSRVNKIEVFLGPVFMFKSSCDTHIQGSGITVKNEPKIRLSDSFLTEMNIKCEPKKKKPLVIIQQKYSSVVIKPLKKSILSENRENFFTIKSKSTNISLCTVKSIIIKHHCSTSLQENQISIKSYKKLFTHCPQLKMSAFCEPSPKIKKLILDKLFTTEVEIKPKEKIKLFNSFENSLKILPNLQKIQISSMPGFMYKSNCKTFAQEPIISIKKLQKFHLTVEPLQEMNQFCSPTPRPQLFSSAGISLSIPKPINTLTLFTSSFKKPSVSLSTLSILNQSIIPYPNQEIKLQNQASFFLKSPKKHLFISIESTLGISKQSLSLQLFSFRTLSKAKSLNLESQNYLETPPLLKNRNFSVSKEFSQIIKKNIENVKLELTGSYARQLKLKVSRELFSEIKPQIMANLEIEIQKNVFIEQNIKNRKFDFSFGDDLSIVNCKPLLELGYYPGSHLKKKLSISFDPVMNLTLNNKKLVYLTVQKIQDFGLIRKKVKKLENVLESNLGIKKKPKNCTLENYGILSISPKERPEFQVSAQKSQSVHKIKPKIMFEAVQNLNRIYNLEISESNSMKIIKSKKTKLQIKTQDGPFIETKSKQCGWSQTHEIIKKFVAGSFNINSKLQIIPQKNSFLINSPEKFLNISEPESITLPKKIKIENSTQISDDLLQMARRKKLITDTQSSISVIKTENIIPKNSFFQTKKFSLSILTYPNIFIKISERPHLKYSIQNFLEISSSTANSYQNSLTDLSIHSNYKNCTIVSATDISIKRLDKNLKIVNNEKITWTDSNTFESSLNIHPILNIRPKLLTKSYECFGLNPNKNPYEKLTMNKRTQILEICKIYSMILTPSYSVLKGSGRESKMEFGSQRDPIKDFFILICQSIKLNSLQKDKIGVIPIDELYRKVLQDKIPFNKWYSYLKQHFLTRMSIRKDIKKNE